MHHAFKHKQWLCKKIFICTFARLMMPMHHAPNWFCFVIRQLINVKQKKTIQNIFYLQCVQISLSKLQCVHTSDIWNFIFNFYTNHESIAVFHWLTPVLSSPSSSTLWRASAPSPPGTGPTLPLCWLWHCTANWSISPTSSRPCWMTWWSSTWPRTPNWCCAGQETGQCMWAGVSAREF